jgi:ankyrin repeat protein
MRENY